MNILIIEDEKRTANDLKRTIFAVVPEAEVYGIVGSVEAGIDFLNNHKQIDLIFSDIQLADGLSFDIFQTTKNDIPVIFCTAYDQFALQAFQTYGIDYILKPFDEPAVKRAIDKYKNLIGTSRPTDFRDVTEAIKQQLFPSKKTTSILIHQGDKLIPLSVDDVAIFFIKDELLSAYTFSGIRYFVDKKLDSLEAELSPTFFRANRQQLIHRRAVRDVSQYFHRKLMVNLSIPFKEEVVVGKLKVTAFKEWLSTV
ncbi:MAG: LytTR family DNA-binding domain-containing protein [Rhodothermaceae bacterium]|nr:LytTR family DNA-binding domain-containing protein [Rhodothermaceae bacterium]